ncbi:DUF5719 family protein [Nocardioides dongkuii]|uniref:DUF5719 family protein n=1 Tax=Nocardioides dongkuii TaxID=2760089 RepID=UPI00187783D3|nr:DUF5719 family protein [Nocardioides dongkuii]
MSRSHGSRRLDPTVLLAVLLPLLCVGLLLVAGTEVEEPAPVPPASTALGAATLACPAALPGTREVAVATSEDASGSVEVGADPVRVAPGRTAVADAPRAVVVRAEGDLAPGLVAGRSGTAPLTATACPAPSADQWFTGVGAGARRSSVLELVNPNAGPAVADVLLLGGAGVVDAPRLRGVLVPGGETRRLELARLAPQRGELAMRVTTTRGRLVAAVEDTEDELGASRPTTDWLGSQAAPERTSVLLGLVGGPGRRSLVLANPGDDEVRAELRVVTADSVFAPSGLQEVRVAPGSTRRVLLSDPLLTATADGAYGLEVRATAPVTATLRTVADGDLSHAVPTDPVTRRTVAVVPTGTKRLLLAGFDAVGLVDVVARDAAGRRVAREQVETTPGAGAVVELPRTAVLVEVVPDRTAVRGAVLTTGDGAAVVRLRELVRSGLVPGVRPGLP